MGLSVNFGVGKTGDSIGDLRVQAVFIEKYPLIHMNSDLICYGIFHFHNHKFKKIKNKKAKDKKAVVSVGARLN